MSTRAVRPASPPTPSQWSVPPVASHSITTFGSSTCWNDDYVLFTLMDITGDGILDMVEYAACANGDPLLGYDYWNVYEGGAAGFASSPSQWTLPSASHLLSPFGSSTCWNDDYMLFTMIDLGGDGLLDLVEYAACANGDPLLGFDYWNVYAGTCIP